MTIVLKLISVAGLGLTVVPAFLVFGGALDWRTHVVWMFVGTVLWFATAPFWMKEGPTGPGAGEADRTEPGR